MPTKRHTCTRKYVFFFAPWCINAHFTGAPYSNNITCTRSQSSRFALTKHCSYPHIDACNLLWHDDRFHCLLYAMLMFNTATPFHTQPYGNACILCTKTDKNVLMSNTSFLGPKYVMCTPYPLWEKMHRRHQSHHYDVFFYGIVDPAPTKKSL